MPLDHMVTSIFGYAKKKPNIQVKHIQLNLLFSPHLQLHYTGQISIIPKPELRGFWGSSIIKPPFRVTSADVVIICPDYTNYRPTN